VSHLFSTVDGLLLILDFLVGWILLGVVIHIFFLARLPIFVLSLFRVN
jgi:hypothetical protein